MIGKKLAHYEILDRIGQGGMGEVYRARDTRLGRTVALKLLSPALSGDPGAMDRLQREARLLAAIQHPNVAVVHGLESDQGQTFIAMEYVEGEDLSTRIRRGRLHCDEAVQIATQIARGLEEAHRHGVVHRDLKPGNVRITGDGTVKLIDFGLARDARDSGRDPSGPDDATVAATLTEAGAILGTPAYMSPEQARGEKVDERTDLWAFGLILYEMLAGERAFAGDTAVDTLSLVLQHEVELGRLSNTAPPGTLRLIERCLRKERQRRLQSAGDARVWLEDIASGVADPPDATSRARARTPLLVLLGLPLLAAAAAWMLKPGPDAALMDPGRYEIAAPEGATFYHRYRHGLAISPDGRTLAFVAGVSDDPTNEDAGHSSIYLRELDSWKATRLEGTEDASQPVFTPDGSAIVFDQDHQIRRIPAAGGQVQTISDTHAHFGLSFLPDGSLVIGRFAAGLGLLRQAGGVVDTLALPDRQAGEMMFDLPHALPDGRGVLFTSRDLATAIDYEQSARIKLLSLETGEQKVLVNGATDARYVPSGHLLYAKEGSLYAIGFDLEHLATVGREVKVVEGVSHAIHAGSVNRETGAAQFAVSRSGTLVYLPGSIFPERIRRLAWIDRDGSREEIPVDPMQYLLARLSPGGDRILLSTNYPPRDIWTWDLERGAMRRQTFDGHYHGAIWGPGPGRFTAAANRDQDVKVLTHALDAGRSAATAMELGQRYWPFQWIDGGSTLLAIAWDGAIVHTIDQQGTETPAFDEPVRGGSLSLSPDQRWLLYSSAESGQTEVFVRRWPDGNTAHQISVSGGVAPGWSRDGSEVFYWRWSEELGEFTMYAVGFSSSAGRPALGSPARLFDAPMSYVAQHRPWDVGADGRFLVVLSHTDSLDAEINRELFPDRMRIATRWLDELGGPTP